jgi:cilia- and flagella-associated protein 57
MAHSSTSSGTVTSHVLRGLGVTKIDGRDQSLMTSEKEILYVAGRNVVWHNLVRDRVRVLPQTPRTQSILAIAVCPKRRYVAVCEQQDQSHYSSTGETPLPQVSIIDLISGAGPKRLRTLIATEDTHLSFNTVLNSDGTIPPPPNFTCAEFSKDSKSLLCLVGAPYNGLVVFDWFRSRKVGTCTINASVNQCRFNPIDSSQVSTSGPQHLRVWKVQEGMLKGYPSIPLPSGGSSITDHAWTKDDRMAATTDHGELLIYDEGVCIQTITSKAIGLEEHDGLSCIAGLDDRGFICGGPRGSVCIVEMTDDKNRLEGRDPFKVPCKVRAIKDKATPQTIISLACSPKCDAVSLCFPDNVGLLNMSDVWLKAEQSSKKEDDENGADGGSKKEVAVSLSDHNEEKEKNTNEIKEMEEEERKMDNSSLSENTQTKLVECDINYIVKGYHTGTITCIATCSRKPFLITCSKEDKSVRLWNYRTHICIDALTFKNDAQRPLCVDIHPSGHLILIGFSGRLHLYHVRIDALRYSREILVKGARMAKFSGHGGLIAVACSRRLEVYRTYTEECIGGFTGK